MAEIGPGDSVECVWSAEQGPNLVVGRVYTVESVVLFPRAKPCACHGKILGGLRLVEAPLRPWESWCVGCFRKRPPAREQLFHEMLAATHETAGSAGGDDSGLSQLTR